MSESEYQRLKDFLLPFVSERFRSTAVNEDLRNLLSKIKNETLLIWGENDTATPLSDGKLMHQEILGSKLIIIPNAGHHPHHDAFENVIEKIDSFL